MPDSSFTSEVSLRHIVENKIGELFKFLSLWFGNGKSLPNGKKKKKKVLQFTPRRNAQLNPRCWCFVSDLLIQTNDQPWKQKCNLNSRLRSSFSYHFLFFSCGQHITFSLLSSETLIWASHLLFLSGGILRFWGSLTFYKFKVSFLSVLFSPQPSLLIKTWAPLCF